MNGQIPAVLDETLRQMRGLQLEPAGPRRMRVRAAPDNLPTLLTLLKGRAGYIHLSAISCVDWPQVDEFELVYHLWSYETRMVVSVHTNIARNPGRYVSVYDLFIPAGYFERDIHEMFGVEFEGSPNLKPFVLSEWNGPPPMLKSFSSRGYVEETYQWQDYQPQWLKEIEAKGGGLER